MDQTPRRFRFLLLLYPPRFRRRFGQEMRATFLSAFHREKSRRSRAAFWLRTIWDALIFASIEWKESLTGKHPRNLVDRPHPPARSEWSRSVGHDLHVALRMLVRKPSFIVAALPTLALGIGANTAVFSVVEAVLWRPLEYGDPDRLVSVWPDRSMSVREISFLREHVRAFESTASIAGWSMALTGDANPTQILGARTSANFFSTLQSRPQLGRVFRADDGLADASRVVVLSHDLWTSRFGTDTAIVGRRVLIDGDPHEVVGVMPASFEFMNPATALWVPLREDESHWTFTANISRVVARLASHRTVQSAEQEFVRLLERMGERFGYPDDYGADAGLLDLKTHVVGSYRSMLWVLLGAVFFILLIAASNLSSLQLTKTGERRREMAVRTALGATRFQLMRIVMVEAMLLSVLGGVVGLAVALGGLELLRQMIPAETPRISNIVLDVKMLGLCSIFALGTGVLSSVIPAFAATRVTPGSAMRRVRIGTSPTGPRFGLRNVWVTCQIAAAVVLVVGAGLMVRTMEELGSIEPGFVPSGLLTLRLQPVGDSYDTPAEYRRFYDDVFMRVSSLTGVSSVGAVQHLPFSGWSWGIPFELVESPINDDSPKPVAGWRIVAGDYLGAMRIRLLTGRWFAHEDGENSVQVAVINRTLADRFWAGDNPIGRRMKLGRNGETIATVIGVVEDVRHESVDQSPRPEIYRPLSQSSMPALMLVVRASGEQDRLEGLVPDAVWSVDSDVPISHVMSYDQLIATTLGRPRFVMTLLTSFALVALVLGAVGVYGVTSFAVVRRSNEIGLRMALGATRRRIGREILEQGMSSAVLGTASGLLGAALLSHFMVELVFSISPRDPTTFVTVGAIMVLVTLTASFLPAMRATRIDPIVTLRNE